MIQPWRLLTLSAAFELTLGIGAAVAQTVIVRNAPAGSPIELVLNTTTVASATADADGYATLAAKLSATTGKTEIDAYVFVELCGNTRRVLLIERGVRPPPPDAGCDRREVTGLFLVRQVSTIVVDVEGPNPTLLLRQESFNPRAVGTSTRARRAPTGLVLFGGAGLETFRDASAAACGNVTQCSEDDAGGAYSAGVAYWITRYLAAETSYLRPGEVNVDGSGDNFRFNSVLEAHVLTLGGKGGVPIGPVRLYGQLGWNYHRATSRTTQTIDSVSVGGMGADSVTQTIPGGTQTFELKTAGWGWGFGGGLEVWVRPWLGVYAEGGRAALKGTAVNGGQGVMDDAVTSLTLGARFHIGP